MVGRTALTAPERGGECSRQHVTQSEITLAFANTVALAQVANLNDGFAHCLNDIGDRCFHSLKKDHAA